MSWYILINREFCILYIDSLFPKFDFCLFSAYYYMKSLSDFRPIFLYEFKLNQSAVETARKINGINEYTYRVQNSLSISTYHDTVE